MTQEFHLLVINSTMPHVTGIGFITGVRMVRKDLPVTLCTDFTESLPQDLADRLRIDEIVIKAVIRSEIAVAIAGALEK